MSKIYKGFNIIIGLILTLFIIGIIYSIYENDTHDACPLMISEGGGLSCGVHGVNVRKNGKCECECDNNTTGSNCEKCKDGFYAQSKLVIDEKGVIDNRHFDCVACTVCDPVDSREISKCKDGNDSQCINCPLNTYFKSDENSDTCKPLPANYPKTQRDMCCACTNCNTTPSSDKEGVISTYDKKCGVYGIDIDDNIDIKIKQSETDSSCSDDIYTSNGGDLADKAKFVLNTASDPPVAEECELCGDKGEIHKTMCSRSDHSICTKKCDNGFYINKTEIKKDNFPWLTEDTTIEMCTLCSIGLNNQILISECKPDLHQDNIWYTCPDGQYVYENECFDDVYCGEGGLGGCPDGEECYLNLDIIKSAENKQDDILANKDNLCIPCDVAKEGELYRRKCSVSYNSIIDTKCSDVESMYIHKDNGEYFCQNCSPCTKNVNTGQTQIIFEKCKYNQEDDGETVSSGSDTVCGDIGKVNYPHSLNTCPNCFPHTSHTDAYRFEEMNLKRLNRCAVNKDRVCDFPNELNTDKCEQNGILTGMCGPDSKCVVDSSLWCGDDDVEDALFNCTEESVTDVYCGSNSDDGEVKYAKSCSDCGGDQCSGECKRNGNECVAIDSEALPGPGGSHDSSYIVNSLSGKCGDERSDYVWDYVNQDEKVQLSPANLHLYSLINESHPPENLFAPQQLSVKPKMVDNYTGDPNTYRVDDSILGDICWVYDGRGKKYGFNCKTTTIEAVCGDEYKCVSKKDITKEVAGEEEGICIKKSIYIPISGDEKYSPEYSCYLNNDAAFHSWAFPEDSDTTTTEWGCYDPDADPQYICDLDNSGMVNCNDTDGDEPVSCYVNAENVHLKYSDFN